MSPETVRVVAASLEEQVVRSLAPKYGFDEEEARKYLRNLNDINIIERSHTKMASVTNEETDCGGSNKYLQTCGNLMSIISPAATQLINNDIIQDMSVIDWGKAMARCNEIIQKDLLNYCGICCYDPEKDDECPNMIIANNSPGFDILVKNTDGRLSRIQSKLRQVKGKTDFSQQTHFETTRRHSKKNEGSSSDTGHIAYSIDEFDYVMITLVNVGKNGDVRSNRNSVDKWSFSIIPIAELVDNEKGCCVTAISAKLLEKYKYTINPESPPVF